MLPGKADTIAQALRAAVRLLRIHAIIHYPTLQSQTHQGLPQLVEIHGTAELWLPGCQTKVTAAVIDSNTANYKTEKEWRPRQLQDVQDSFRGRQEGGHAVSAGEVSTHPLNLVSVDLSAKAERLGRETKITRSSLLLFSTVGLRLGNLQSLGVICCARLQTDPMQACLASILPWFFTGAKMDV